MKLNFNYKNFFCFFVLAMSGIILEKNVLAMNSNSECLQNKLKRKRELTQKELDQGTNRSIKLQCIREEKAVENALEPAQCKKGFKFSLFKPQQCPVLLKEILGSIQDEHEDAEILTTQWQYCKGYYSFKAYHSNSLDSLIPFLQEKKSLDFTLNIFHMWCEQYSDNSVFLEYLFNLQLKKAEFEKEAGEDAQTACKRMLSAQYKIHLTPQKEQLQNVIERIIREFIHNQELRSLVCEFKVCKKFLELSTDQDVTDMQALAALEQDVYCMPAIVICPRDGQEHAQRALKIITELFDDLQGLIVMMNL